MAHVMMHYLVSLHAKICIGTPRLRRYLLGRRTYSNTPKPPLP